MNPAKLPTHHPASANRGVATIAFPAQSVLCTYTLPPCKVFKVPPAGHLYQVFVSHTLGIVSWPQETCQSRWKTRANNPMTRLQHHYRFGFLTGGREPDETVGSKPRQQMGCQSALTDPSYIPSHHFSRTRLLHEQPFQPRVPSRASTVPIRWNTRILRRPVGFSVA